MVSSTRGSRVSHTVNLFAQKLKPGRSIIVKVVNSSVHNMSGGPPAAGLWPASAPDSLVTNVKHTTPLQMQCTSQDEGSKRVSQPQRGFWGHPSTRTWLRHGVGLAPSETASVHEQPILPSELAEHVRVRAGPGIRHGEGDGNGGEVPAGERLCDRALHQQPAGASLERTLLLYHRHPQPAAALPQ